MHYLFLTPLPLLSRHCLIKLLSTFLRHHTRRTQFLSSYSLNPMSKFPNLKSSASDTEIHLGDDQGVHFGLDFDSFPRFLPSGCCLHKPQQHICSGYLFHKNTTEMRACWAIEATRLQREQPCRVMETQSCVVADRFIQNKPSEFPIISNTEIESFHAIFKVG